MLTFRDQGRLSLFTSAWPQKAKMMALIIPPKNPGSPWRLFTPQVSCIARTRCSFSVNLLKQIVEMQPPNSPIRMLARGFTMSPEGAPMITPPAKDAFNRSSMLNLSLIMEVTMNEPRQLPVRESTVLEAMRDFSKPVLGKQPALKEGQYIHRKRVPIMAKELEVALVLGSLVQNVFLPRKKLTIIPQKAPNVWIAVLPPASKSFSWLQTRSSFKVYPKIPITPMIKSSRGPTFPSTAPKAIRMEATEQEAAVKLLSFTFMYFSSQLFIMIWCQKGWKSKQS